MRITIKKMEVTVLSGRQQLQGMRTARTFERELERIAERASNAGDKARPQKPRPRND